MLIWLVVGASWVAQSFLPWAASGALAASSSMDAVHLIRTGLVEPLLPGWAALVLLILPMSGVLVMALAGLSSPWTRPSRLLLTAASTAMFVVLFLVLLDGSPGRLGPGGWLTLGSIQLALAALAADAWGSRPRVPTPSFLPPVNS